MQQKLWPCHPEARCNPAAKNECFLHGSLFVCLEEVESSVRLCMQVSVDYVCLSVVTTLSHDLSVK